MKFRTRNKQKHRRDLELIGNNVAKWMQNDRRKYNHLPQTRTGLWVKVYLKNHRWILR